ncbi:SGNH/GDSL hydrolase family protein [Nocardia yamanashiensis]|uniref:SGNH/GDSL hydrolase family protein n=1 Tax=Nocardia yamanashiensis TaxID=209247 RepID=UPI001E559234|nr:SGNH/GDSL hydrolase family protein [Nocardia yamanashiensis]UGT43029.1 SGNH/GDSL hydrolase family protein [Nocardia yamanashiensis]
MRLHTRGGRALGVAAAAVAVAATMSGGMSGGVSAAADPAAGKELVVLGDSFTANDWNPLAAEQTCLRGDTAWPAQLSRLMGIQGTDQVTDRSCVGASIDTGPGYTLAMEAREADQAGAFGPRTKLVTIQFGLNDHWGGSQIRLWDAMRDCVFDLEDGCGVEAVSAGRMPDSVAISGAAYADRIRNVVTYIRYYAPNARIVLVGYPEVVPANADSVCLDFFGFVPFVQPRGRTIVDALNRIDAAQRDAAQRLSLEFLDARALTAGHGLCTAEPWVNGVFSPGGKIDGLPFHPSPAGDAVIAKALNERYGR